MPYKHKLDPSTGSPDYPGYTPPHKYKGKNTHSWALYKFGSEWAFNHWECMKLDEQLLGGSEKCLDWHYKQLTGDEPNYCSMMYATFSTDLSTFGEYKPTTKLLWLKEWEKDPTASYYLDEACGMEWWLCPFWADLHPNHTAPKETYLLLTPYSY